MSSETCDIRKEIAAGVRALAVRQHDVISIAQLLACGMTPSAVTRQVKSGRMVRLHRGVYALGHVPRSRESQWMAAVLAAGPGAALSHTSAAALWGVEVRGSRGIDVLVPVKRSSMPGVRVHQSRLLDPTHFTVRTCIRTSTMTRALLDLGDRLTAPQLANVMHEADFRHRLDVPALRDLTRTVRGRGAVGVLADALDLHLSGSVGTRSVLEDEFLPIVELAGLGPPLINVRIGKIEVDFHWPQYRLVVEVDGSGHRRARTRREDAERDRRLTADGWHVIRLTARDLRYPQASVARLRDAAHLRVVLLQPGR